MNGNGEKLLNSNHEEVWKFLYVLKKKSFKNINRKFKKLKYFSYLILKIISSRKCH